MALVRFRGGGRIGEINWGETLEDVTVLKLTETARIDPARLEEIYCEMGVGDAENTVCRALEDLALCLSQAERGYRERRDDDMRNALQTLHRIAEQIGMRVLAQVAGDALGCLGSGDQVALAAVLGRVLRIGESSLNEIWDLRDITI